MKALLSCVAVVCLATPVRAAPVIPAPSGSPGLDAPLRLRAGNGRLERPTWTDEGLLPSLDRRFRGLAAVEQPGLPAYDPTSRAFYASANGALVRLEPDGALPVIVTSGVQGIDVDVRPARQLAVSREPDHRILLTRWRGREVIAQRTLLRGARFFHPRLAPDGASLLVSESRPRGAHLWRLVLDGGAPIDLGRADDAAWHPDGQRVIFTRVRHDGHRVTAADLWELQIASGRRRRLARTPGRAEVEPAVSPDGRWVAFVDAATGDLFAARLP
jgi:hypothetical protein